MELVFFLRLFFFLLLINGVGAEDSNVDGAETNVVDDNVVHSDDGIDDKIKRRSSGNMNNMVNSNCFFKRTNDSATPLPPR